MDVGIQEGQWSLHCTLVPEGITATFSRRIKRTKGSNRLGSVLGTHSEMRSQPRAFFKGKARWPFPQVGWPPDGALLTVATGTGVVLP